jgi:hypothetical protein
MFARRSGDHTVQASKLGLVRLEKNSAVLFQSTYLKAHFACI